MLRAPAALWDLILTGAKAAAGALDGVKLHLYVNNFQPTKDSVLGDFTEAAFGGYAASAAIVWGSPFPNADGTAAVLGALITFMSTDAVTPQTVYGYYATNTLGTVLLWSERLGTPKVFAADGNTLAIVPRFQAGPIA